MGDDSTNNQIMNALIPAICGFAYGTSSVIVGQPLETIKTQMQTKNKTSIISTTQSIIKNEGILGLYRGGIPLILGGSLIRSAQFGVYDNVFAFLNKNEYGFKVFGAMDSNIIVAGVCGGLGRGAVEGPFEYIKVRQQVKTGWKFREMFHGYGTTMFRNSILFASFVMYIDISKQIIPGGLSPFFTGAICSSLGWLTVWPLDVVKSRIQSGLYPGKSFLYILGDISRNNPRQMLSGIVPGLMRSSIANGCSMFIYKKIEVFLKGYSNTKPSSET